LAVIVTLSKLKQFGPVQKLDRGNLENKTLFTLDSVISPFLNPTFAFAHAFA